MSDLPNPNFNGVTLRDWFAGMAMQAIIVRKGFPPIGSDEELFPGAMPSADIISEASYEMADAMLKRREETRVENESK